jgi:hypothetical protein
MTAGVLWLLLALFVLRVLGQALVAFFNVGFLPPMPAWYSGLMPYEYLLPSQLGFGYLYLAAMVARALFLWDRPIPIVFHWVLAAFVITVGHSHRQRLAT